MTFAESDASARDILADLRRRYPDSPFLALGQTVFWDEPVKAVLRRLLDENELGGQMVIGVHDTDYFAKAPVRRETHGRFALLAHNDGTTKNLWSAAGEISTLFGSETFPSRHDLAKHGVAFRKAQSASGLEAQAFLDAVTEAWGWRGLVYTGQRDLIVNRLPLRDVGDGVITMLTWGFENALTQVVPGCCQDEARQVAEMVLGWCREFRAEHPAANLTHLFQHVLPRFYTLLLGHPPENVSVSSTADLLCLRPETAHLPRFRFVNLFLDPATRETALSAYNHVVNGTEMYTLDKFGANALPFDCIVPGRGRGTLRVSPRVLFIETKNPVAIGLKSPITSVQELAETLTNRLGAGVTLVGKAVTLVSMLAQEFIFVFSEEGSMYVRRTRQMNDLLAAQGVALDMRPILRLRYHTWDALDAGRSTLRPAPHLAAAFGQPTVTTPEFAANWKSVIAEQRELCQTSANLRKPLELLDFLQARQPLVGWDERIAAYSQARQNLRRLRNEGERLHADIAARYAELRELRARTVALQKQQGEAFRAMPDNLSESAQERASLEAEWQGLTPRKRELQTEIQHLRARLQSVERGPEAQEARGTLARIEDAAELARLELVRDALLTIEGLAHTNHRPSAWWLPMVDSSGAWFRRIAGTTELYTEPLMSQE